VKSWSSSELRFRGGEVVEVGAPRIMWESRALFWQVSALLIRKQTKGAKRGPPEPFGAYTRLFALTGRVRQAKLKQRDHPCCSRTFGNCNGWRWVLQNWRQEGIDEDGSDSNQGLDYG
jgi:hypothetical protein